MERYFFGDTPKNLAEYCRRLMVVSGLNAGAYSRFIGIYRRVRPTRALYSAARQIGRNRRRGGRNVIARVTRGITLKARSRLMQIRRALRQNKKKAGLSPVGEREITRTPNVDRPNIVYIRGGTTRPDIVNSARRLRVRCRVLSGG